MRARWLATLQRLSEPVLTNLAAGTLKARMPVEEVSGANRRGVTHLEAFGRLMAGIAPWLDLDEGPADERALRTRYRALTSRALAQALDPASPDALNFTEGGQPLVDAAFLAQAVLRAPRVLQQDAMALLPLGLPPSDPFWADPPHAWTAKRAWEGQEFQIDQAIAE